MRYTIRPTVAVAIAAVTMWPIQALAETEPSAYTERWASGTLTTGELFESWRIHVVVPDTQDWGTSSIDGWLTSGPTWYYNYSAGIAPANPDLFGLHPDAEFATYWTSPHLYPNSDLSEPGGMGMTGDGVHEPTYVHLGGWFDWFFDTNGDYIVWQGTVIDPIPSAYGTITFGFATHPEPFVGHCTFTIPEPASAVLLALGLVALLRRR